MRYLLTRNYTILIITLFLASVFVSPTVAQRGTFEKDFIEEVEFGASRLNYKLDHDQKAHFTYLIGPAIANEPNLIAERNNTHQFVYGSFEVLRDVNGRVNLAADILVNRENITDDLVFPFHYNFQIDSLGQIHTAYIKDNYTLFYAVRDILGTWTETKLTTSDNWYAAGPDITLGENEEPRIVTAVKYRNGSNEYWNVPEGYTLNNILSIHYDYLKAGVWHTYDVTNNHFPERETPGLSHDFRNQGSQRTYNPAIVIDNGRAWIAYNNKNQLSVESRIQLLDTVEFPDELDLADYAFFDNTTLKTAISSTISTVYSRPSIILLPVNPLEPEKQPIVLGFGSWTFGGVNLAFTLDANRHLSTLWRKFELDRTLRSREVKSFDAVYEPINDTIYATWSVYDRFDTAENRYTFDIRMIIIEKQAFDDLKLEAAELDFSRVTDTNNVDNTYPSIVLIDQIEPEIVFLQLDPEFGEPPEIRMNRIGEFIPIQGGGEIGFLIGLGLTAAAIVGAHFAFRLIPIEKEDEEIQPHMLNLKDSIIQE